MSLNGGEERIPEGNPGQERRLQYRGVLGLTYQDKSLLAGESIAWQVQECPEGRSARPGSGRWGPPSWARWSRPDLTRSLREIKISARLAS